MKKIFLLILAFVFLTINLVACDSMGSTPTNSHEKVTYAFKGVEKSLKNVTVKNTSSQLFGRKASASYLAESNDPLSIIYGAMRSENGSELDIEYNQPPFIQFQYLKAIYEEIGDDFKFNTKYTYHLTGNIYYDFTNRSNEETENNLVNYDFDFSILINIDDNDVITANVGFDVIYKNNTNLMHYQTRYAELRLEYDMNNTNPTYKLLMRDLDDLTKNDNEEEKYASAEYDYLDMNQGKVNEWRKFGACTKTSLLDYDKEDFIYKYTVLRAYKDNKIYYIENSFNKDEKLKDAVINGLDLVKLVNDSKTYLAKQAEENTKIKTIVDKFNKTFGKDFVNHFVYTGATEKWEGSNNNQGRRVDETWPTDKFEDLEVDVPGFYSETATFTSSVDFQTNGVAITVIVNNDSNNDFDDYINDLLQHGYQKTDEGYFFKQDADSSIIVAISNESKSIYFGIVDRNHSGEAVKIMNSPAFNVPYDSYEQEYFSDAKDVATYILSMTNKVTMDQIIAAVKVDECAKYEILLDKEYENIIEQYNGYVGEFGSWNRFDGDANVFYTELSDKDVLVVLNRQDLFVYISVFTFNSHAISDALAENNNNNNNNNNDPTTVDITIKAYFDVPANHHLYFASDVNGWQANPDFELVSYETGIYEKTITLEKDQMMEYKIILTNDKNIYWEIYQGNPDMNRFLIGDINNPIIEINDLIFQGYEDANNNEENNEEGYLVTFKVERQVEDGHTMYIAGSFTDWENGRMVMTKVEDEDAWTISLRLQKGNYQYKYMDDLKWSPDPNINIVVSDNAVILDSWANAEISAQKVDVTFSINYELEDGKQLGLCADFNNWSNKEFLTKDENNNWTITYTLGVGVTYEYKFFILDNGTETWETFSGNRTITIFEEQTLIALVFNQN